MFRVLALDETGTVTASAEGHASEVIEDFHSVCTLLLAKKGPWRITDVTGSIPDGDELDSAMEWVLIAKIK